MLEDRLPLNIGYPFILIYVEEYPDQSMAFQHECLLKSLEGGAEKHRIVASLTNEQILETQQRFS